jgi:hypothetical protein
MNIGSSYRSARLHTRGGGIVFLELIKQNIYGAIRIDQFRKNNFRVFVKTLRKYMKRMNIFVKTEISKLIKMKKAFS